MTSLITMVPSLLNTKLVCHVLIKTDKGMYSYTCFNYAVESYVRIINHPLPLADMPIESRETIYDGRQNCKANSLASVKMYAFL